MYPFWFGLILPFVVVYLFNWAMFIIIIIVCLVKNRKNVSSLHHKKKRELRRHFFLVLGLSLVFGLVWGFGFLATSSDIKELTFTFQILYSILISSQGLLIFVFHVIRAPQAREQWKKLFIKFPAINRRGLFQCHLPSLPRHPTQCLLSPYLEKTIALPTRAKKGKKLLVFPNATVACYLQTFLCTTANCSINSS